MRFGGGHGRHRGEVEKRRYIKYSTSRLAPKGLRGSLAAPAKPAAKAVTTNFTELNCSKEKLDRTYGKIVMILFVIINLELTQFEFFQPRITRIFTNFYPFFV